MYRITFIREKVDLQVPAGMTGMVREGSGTCAGCSLRRTGKVREMQS